MHAQLSSGIGCRLMGGRGADGEQLDEQQTCRWRRERKTGDSVARSDFFRVVGSVSEKVAVLHLRSIMDIISRMR